MDVMKIKTCASKDSYQQSKNATHRSSLVFFQNVWRVSCTCVVSLSQYASVHVSRAGTLTYITSTQPAKPGSQHWGRVILQFTDGPRVLPASPQCPFLFCGLASSLGSRVACHCLVSFLDFSPGTLLWTIPVFHVLDHWVFPQVLKIVIKCT